MLKALNTAATGMQAQQTQMEVVSNNIANVGTTGFKKSRAEFEDLLYHTLREPGAKTTDKTELPVGVQTGLGVKVSSTQKIFDEGAAKITRNPLDLAVEGSGFFPIQMGNGQIGYTRDGTFHKDAGGRVVDKNGNPLIPEIIIPPNAVGVNIEDNGKVLISTQLGQAPQQIGQIQLVNFINPAGLKSAGRNLFVPSPASGQPQQGIPGENNLGMISQGQLETSNVNVVDEMVNMIQTQRSYETNSKVIQAADQMLQNSNNLR